MPRDPSKAERENDEQKHANKHLFSSHQSLINCTDNKKKKSNLVPFSNIDLPIILS